LTENVIRDIERQLARLATVLDLDRYAIQCPEPHHIVRYYRRSRIAYSLVHSRQGSLHVALNENGVFDKRGYRGQPERVARLIDNRSEQALELGAGRGFNLAYLAHRHPAVRFRGIDLVPVHGRDAARLFKRQGLRNAEMDIGDYHDLPYNGGSFQLAYAIETLSHARSPSQPFAEAFRVLQPGGRLLVIDQWRTRALEQMATPVQRAATVIEASWSTRPLAIDDWLDRACAAGFAVEDDSDLSSAVMPTLRRFQRIADLFLDHERLAKASRRFMRPELLSNAISASLWGLTLEAGAYTYRAITLRRAMSTDEFRSTHA
jgi:ubiquinone/menaquinone biosynthesis C-methylase UbiE